MSLKDKIACVITDGLFLPLATRLARDFGKVYFYSTWEKGSPFFKDGNLGVGLEGVERENYPLSLIGTKNEPNLWVFPDISENDLQGHLRSIGKRIWGSGRGHMIENDRWLLKETLDKAGLPVIYTRLVKGVDALRKILEEEEDLFIKVSTWRGDTETREHKSWAQTQFWWFDMCKDLGPLCNSMEFLVEWPIEDATEVGVDGIIIDGTVIHPMMIGYEIKDSAYFGKVVEEPPEILAKSLRVMADWLKGKNYANFFSTEMRITKAGECFFTDASARRPCPPGEVHDEMWSNLCPVMYGQLRSARLEPVAKYACELILSSDYAGQRPVEISYPEKWANRVKIYRAVKVDGKTFATPDEYHTEQVGAVVGLGATMQAAEDEAKAIADEVKGFHISYDEGVFDKAKKQIAAGEKLGIRF